MMLLCLFGTNRSKLMNAALGPSRGAVSLAMRVTADSSSVTVATRQSCVSLPPPVPQCSSRGAPAPHLRRGLLSVPSAKESSQASVHERSLIGARNNQVPSTGATIHPRTIVSD